MGKKIKCGCGAIAEVKYTKQKPGALRRMPPKPYTDCPTCGPVYGSSKGRVDWILRDSYDDDTTPPPETKPDTVPDNTPGLSDNSQTEPDNQHPPKKGGFFSGWAPL